MVPADMPDDADLTQLEGFDARPGSPLLGVASMLAILVFNALYLVCMAPVVLLAPGWLAPRSCPALRFWGRTILTLAGIRLEVHGAERLDSRDAQLVLFTHQSLLDLGILAALWPARGTVAYKREFHAIPLMGRTMRAMGMTPIDRGRREAAKRSLDEIVRRMREERSQAQLSPEGTRSKARGLLPFKRGPFHVALQTGAPIIPMVMRGVRQVMPPGTWLLRSGTVRVDYLEPIDTSSWRVADLDRHVRETRARFLELVPDATPDGTPDGTPDAS